LAGQYLLRVKKVLAPLKIADYVFCPHKKQPPSYRIDEISLKKFYNLQALRSSNHTLKSARATRSQLTNKISPEDLKVMREKFPQLNDFSKQFLQSRILEELLWIESTAA
jgi:hypothetical protein